MKVRKFMSMTRHIRTERAATTSTSALVNPARARARHARPKSRKSLGRRVISAALGMALVGGGAYAATNWVVGLNAGSSGEGQSATVSDLTITAVASPAATNQLYPG